MSETLKKQLKDKQAEVNSNLEVIQHLSHKNESLLAEVVDLITKYFQSLESQKSEKSSKNSSYGSKTE